ncbi:NAD-dependent epimerase/dehydratase family protein [Polymorphobacter fuscus]|uniref:NAD(P)H-binding protein n=1 Tax=Sandarakinorhabdus fusca TaxID=1439888 RepID=A0A7C9GVP3_9SPHN|nr:NAD(P)H-binding protein [Polymorphobacter fuscus]KAB7646437.1 NAD(P)H-binding protein [Polymorphobacter fuscus]MQT17678.1 NAD(P)H-binding protein [Polymorphobacter fuscus]NJC09777.1 nucleoside-diphosphate-sugar epimerase [Polymorphobacter fuscus]
MTIAITGATGFVGQRVLALANTPVRALTRTPRPARPDIGWIAGDLADTAALAALCDGASAVIHIAGVVSAPTREVFDAANVAGTATVLAAAQAAGVRRFVHVSSLAAREAQLSMYGASKAAAEQLVMASALDWVIVRPPGVYGPADAEMRDIYKLAARGLYIAPPGRISLLHVDDLAGALLALAGGGPSHRLLEIDDGAANGHSHADFAQAIGGALGRRVRVIPLPVSMLHVAARIGLSAKLTRDRARYIAHPDWVARGGNAALAGVWRPEIGLAEGVADTVAGFRAKAWL